MEIGSAPAENSASQSRPVSWACLSLHRLLFYPFPFLGSIFVWDSTLIFLCCGFLYEVHFPELLWEGLVLIAGFFFVFFFFNLTEILMLFSVSSLLRTCIGLALSYLNVLSSSLLSALCASVLILLQAVSPHSSSVSAFSSSTLNHFWRPLKYSRIHPFPCAVSSDLPRCRITYSQHFHIGLLQWVLFQYSLASRKTFAIIFERKGSQPRSF